jgi:hypothetical protein
VLTDVLKNPMELVDAMLYDCPPARHILLGLVHVHLSVPGVDDLALIKFNLDPLPMCNICLVGVGDWINAYILPSTT